MPTPRWSITVYPSESENPFEANALNSIVVNAEGVTRGEVTAVLAGFLAALSKHPAEALPTVDQVNAYKAEQALLRDHPAEVIYVCGGESVWLANDSLALNAIVDESMIAIKDVLAENGWTKAAPVPSGVARACDWWRDADALIAKILHAGSSSDY